MTAQQVVWPEGDVWVGRRQDGLRYRVGGRQGMAPAAAVCPLIAPRAAGGPVLWLDALGTLSGPASETSLRGLTAAASDPGLLVAAREDGVLLLVSEQACTSAGLPALPLAVAALGAERGSPSLCLLALPQGVQALSWQDEHIVVQALAAACAREVILLAGDPPAAVVRLPGGDVDRLLLFLHRSAPWTGWWPLPPLLVATGEPSRLRQTDMGLCVRVGPSHWLLHRGGAWRETVLADQEGVSTHRHGRFAAWDLEPWSEKKQIPSPGKLVVGRDRLAPQEPMTRENSSQRDGAFVPKPPSR